MLPIEKGCNAVVINSEAGNNGKSVVVGKFLGNVPRFFGKDHWEVDQPMNTIDTFVDGGKGKGLNVYHMRECSLMRIDGYSDRFEFEGSEELIMEC